MYDCAREREIEIAAFALRYTYHNVTQPTHAGWEVPFSCHIMDILQIIVRIKCAQPLELLLACRVVLALADAPQLLGHPENGRND